MKAVQINKYGEVDVLQVNNNAEKPIISEGQVLIEVYAASINPFDFAVLKGYVQKFISQGFPLTMGGDFSGKKVDTGEEVYGTAIILGGGSGSLAEFARVSTDKIAVKPKNISFEEAASLPLVGSSAIQALEDHINLQPGQKILIHGGAGGIGSLAIQLAKLKGAYVATTVSNKDKEYVKSLGADETIDYKNERFESLINNYDAVFDTVGGEVVEKSFLVLKAGGVLVSMKGQPDEELAKKYGVTAIGQNSKTNTQHLDRLRELVEQGKIKPQIDKIFPLDQAKEAFLYKEKSHPRGKVVIKVK